MYYTLSSCNTALFFILQFLNTRNKDDYIVVYYIPKYIKTRQVTLIK